MAEASITFLLENLQKLLSDHVHLISGAEGELKQLQNELDLMKAFLVESANRREKGELFRQFETQIRDVVYETEDTLDTCLVQAAAGMKRNFFARNLNPKGAILARTVKALRENEVKPIFERAKIDFANLQIADQSAATAEQDRPKKMPLLREDNVIGFDGEADTIIEYLMEESEELEVISIVGMPGLGKTTLAWKIYKDPRVQFEFPTMIWVYVSQEFNRRNVFLTILKKFTQQDMSSKTDNELASLIRSYLEKLRFILFMDDVWTVEAWKDIEAALPKSNRLGKVLITSRHESVAKQANRKRDPHRLCFLDSMESWKLLRLEVFHNFVDCPPKLGMLGKHIASQCEGVPLAIVVIGGILVKKISLGEADESKTEWEKVSKSVSSHIAYDKEKRTKKIIAMSYNQLSHDLRDCFLYLGMFPEDSEIEVWKLTRLWIAEGFIQEKPHKSLEEVAEDNLKDLINMSLVMVGKTKAGGGIKTCRIHDMIREFCKTEAGTSMQNLFQEMKKSRGVFYPRLSEIEKYRRLCIHSYVLDFLRGKPKGPRVRSFLCFSKEAINLPQEYIPSIPRAFDLLRVLDVNPIKFLKFPIKLTQLIHLRYIALSGDEFKSLPDAVSKLWNLQTIRIDTMSRTFEIKANIWKMRQLRHLKTKAAITFNKDLKGESAENLQTLSRLSAQCCTEELFDRTPNLINLGIRGELAILSDNNNCLRKLNRLQKLKLVYDVFPNVTSENRLSRLPQPDRFPPNLRILELSATHLNWTHMSTLGKLIALKVLKLKDFAFMGKFWKAWGDSYFASLEYLLISCTNLECWTFSTGHFPSLKCLVLKNCWRLYEIPLQLKKSLQILDIEHVSRTAVASAKRIQEEKRQMQGQRAIRGGFKLIIAHGDEQ